MCSGLDGDMIEQHGATHGAMDSVGSLHQGRRKVERRLMQESGDS